MLDEQDLLAIAQLIDQKLEEKLEKKLEEKLARQKEEILTEATHRMQVLLDAEVKPMFNLLAEDISIIQEKLMPESRIERIEDDVWALKASVRRINQDLRELKQAQ
ncbi:MAG: hypothetical protein HFF51_08490 [Lawsonibacter sp.]|mgnify:FL=1|nr:hypothetical protein [Lawsonibacter sp.]